MILSTALFTTDYKKILNICLLCEVLDFTVRSLAQAQALENLLVT